MAAGTTGEGARVPDGAPIDPTAGEAAAGVERVVTLVRELVPAGPQADPATAQGLHDDLHNAAATAPDLVLGVMDLPGEREREARRRMADGALVVDRPGWAKVNAQSFAMVGAALQQAGRETGESGEPAQAGRETGESGEPAQAGHAARSEPEPGGPGGQQSVSETRSRVLAQTGSALAGTADGVLAGTTAVEMGTALAVMAPRVLGQFDPFGHPARLVLVAPTILEVERRLNVEPRDFRLWVALHESTHKIQFATAPWLRRHLLGLLTGAAGAAIDDRLRLPELIRNILYAVRHGGSLLDIVSTEAQRAHLDRITAVMSLLEGHADVVMDAVGPGVIPSVDSIRSRFDARRGESGGVRGLLGRALGMSDKLEQYERGAGFVRGVVDRVGHAGLAAVWEGPEQLPTMAELAAPGQWVDRVLA